MQNHGESLGSPTKQERKRSLVCSCWRPLTLILTCNITFISQSSRPDRNIGSSAQLSNKTRSKCSGSGEEEGEEEVKEGGWWSQCLIFCHRGTQGGGRGLTVGAVVNHSGDGEVRLYNSQTWLAVGRSRKLRNCALICRSSGSSPSLSSSCKAPAQGFHRFKFH